MEVLTDTRCPFCRSCVRLLNRLDRHKRITFLDLHDEKNRKLFQVNYEQAFAKMHSKLGNEIYVGAPAVFLAVDQALGISLFKKAYSWSFFARACDGLYAWVATHRYLFIRRQDVCDITPRSLHQIIAPRKNSG